MTKILGVYDVMGVRKLWRMLFGELLGTFLLVFIGIGSCARNNESTPDILQIAFTFGLTVTALVQIFGPISGGHINPAVTVGFMVVGDMSILKGVLYMFMQCLGAVAGCALLSIVIPEAMGSAGLGVSNFPSYMAPGQALLIEALITAVLVFVVKTVSDPHRKDTYGMGPLLVGLAVVIGHLSAIKLSSAGMNPARSLGPAVIHNTWANHWVYWIGPMVGSVIISIVYKIAFRLPKGDNEFNSYDL